MGLQQDHVVDISEKRLWKTLDTIFEKLEVIEGKLSEVVRLEEKVNNLSDLLERIAKKLESHDERLRDSELWQANRGDKSSVERMITNLQDEVKDLKESKNISKGRTSVEHVIFKWVFGIIATVAAYNFMGGS